MKNISSEENIDFQRNLECTGLSFIKSWQRMSMLGLALSVFGFVLRQNCQNHGGHEAGDSC